MKKEEKGQQGQEEEKKEERVKESHSNTLRYLPFTHSSRMFPNVH